MMGATLAELAVKLSMTGMNLTKGVTTPLTLKPAHELNSDDDDIELLGTCEMARRIGVPISTLTYWDRIGVLPKSKRITGSNRRVWFSTDIPAIERAIEAYRSAST